MAWAAMSEEDESGLGLAFGSEEEGRAMVGCTSGVRRAEFAVEAGMVQYYAGAVEDANDSYWSEEFAREQWGGLIAPPGMLQSWCMPLPWRPGGADPERSIVSKVPLPGDKPINISTEVEYFRPIRVGDRLQVEDRVIAVSTLKQTLLGPGHFLTTVSEYRNQDGELVARAENVLLRYKARDGGK